jgi:hypothetical protein
MASHQWWGRAATLAEIHQVCSKPTEAIIDPLLFSLMRISLGAQVPVSKTIMGA